MKIVDIKNLFLNNIGVRQTVFKNTFWLAFSEALSRFLEFILIIYMFMIEDPAYVELKRICPYTARKLEVILSFRNNGGVPVLNGIDCPDFQKQDFRCRDDGCVRSDKQCGYAEYPNICSLIKK